jgi:hypothetical protein
MDQTGYISKILARFDTCNVYRTNVPMRAIKFSKVKCPQLDTVPRYDCSDCTTKYYREIIGSLMYAVLTRPDIAYAVHRLAQYVENPLPHHWDAVMYLLGYIKAHNNYKLTYTPGPIVLKAYVDSDFAGCIDTSRSTSGFVIFINNCVINFKSVVQKSTAMSSTEAEYVAAAQCASYISWFRAFLDELDHKQITPTRLFEDNEGVEALAKNPVKRSKARHIRRAYHFLREMVTEFKTLSIHPVRSNKNIADIFTKPVQKNILSTLLPFLFDSNNTIKQY